MRIILICIYNIVQDLKYAMQMQIILILIQKNIDKLWQYLKYVQLLAQILQSFWIFNTLSCNPRASISNIFNTSQTLQIALCGLIFFLVVRYSPPFQFNTEQNRKPQRTVCLYSFPLVFALGMLDAW